MAISELTLKSNDLEPVRRFEVFTGSGRRREWPQRRRRGSLRRATRLVRRFVLYLADVRLPRSNCLPGAELRVSLRRRRRHQNPVRSCGGCSVLAGTGGAAPRTTTVAEDGPRRWRDRA